MNAWFKLRPAAVLLPALLAGLAGCLPGAGRGREGVEAVFERASAAYLEGRFAEAARQFRSCQRRYPRAPRRAEATYWEGMSLLASGRLRSARQRLRAARRQSRDRNLTAQAFKGEARALFLAGDSAGAEAIYARLRREYAAESDAAELLAALIQCRSRQGDAAGAARYRRELLSRHPDSPYVEAGVGADTGAYRAPRSRRGPVYVVQAGMFSSRPQAQSLAAALRRSGFASLLKSRPVGAKPMYAVQAGAFSSQAAAERQARALRAKGFPAVVRNPPD